MNFYFQDYPKSTVYPPSESTKYDPAYARPEDLFTYLNLPDEHLFQLRQYFTHHTYARKQFLLTTGELCDKLFFIAKGAVRMFIENGEKDGQTLLLLTEGNLVTCLESFLDNTKSTVNIQATENSIILSLNYTDLHRMLHEMPASMTAFSTALSKKIFFHQKFSKILREDTKTKFEYMQNNLPQIYSRFPLKYLASFVGVKPETLSRLRANIQVKLSA